MLYTISSYRLSWVRDSSVQVPGADRQVSHPSSAAEILNTYLAGADREHFVALLLNTKNRVIGLHTISVGTLSASLVSPREVFKAAIVGNAAAIVLGHNHPSGDPTPSPQDIQVTRTLRKAGELLEIPVLDHIVLGDDGRYISLKQTEGWQ